MPVATIGPAIETDMAMPIRSRKSLAIKTALEYDTAMPIGAIGGASAAAMGVAAVTQAQTIELETGAHLAHEPFVFIHARELLSAQPAAPLHHGDDAYLLGFELVPAVAVIALWQILRRRADTS